MIKIKLQYFKQTGKFYSDGEFEVPDDTHMYQVFNRVRFLQEHGMLPGLIVNGGREFRIYVDGDLHPLGYPAIIEPLQEQVTVRCSRRCSRRKLRAAVRGCAY